MNPAFTTHNGRPYPTYIEPGCLTTPDCINVLRSYGNRFAIISDSNVSPLYAHRLCSQLVSHGLSAQVFEFPAGEHSKSRATKAKLEDQLFNEGLGRDSAIIALGGGVTLDLAGFIAATYCRGIPAIYIPTSLLAMIDVCIGGKTGINTAFGKNTLGTFTCPKAVILDPDVLQTLPQREYQAGLAESLKHGLIYDRDFFLTHQADNNNIESLLLKNITIKDAIVSQDEYEQNLRQILNFGHTIGHALETASNYTLLHGEAVALGILAEAYISMQMGYLEKVEFDLIYQGISKVNPSQSDQIDMDKAYHALKYDKKNRETNVYCVLLKQIGQVHTENNQYSHAISETMLKAALSWLAYR